MATTPSVLLIEAYDDLRTALADLIRTNGLKCHAVSDVASSMHLWGAKPRVALVEDRAFPEYLRLVPLALRKRVTTVVLTRQPNTQYPQADHVVLKPFDPIDIVRFLKASCLVSN